MLVENDNFDSVALKLQFFGYSHQLAAGVHSFSEVL